MLDDLFGFLQGAVTPYHAAAIAAAWLDAAGYTRLEEADYWNLEAGKGYYITRNGSSVIAWRVPEHAIGGWRIAASHSDSPCWLLPPERRRLRRHDHVHLAGPPADGGWPRHGQDRGRHREPPCQHR